MEQDKINVQGYGDGYIVFSGPGWKAKIVQSQTPLETPNQYVFEFTGYQTQDGIPLSSISMNVLLTAIEKAFLTTDLDATVVRRPKAMKTKTNFF